MVRYITIILLIICTVDIDVSRSQIPSSSLDFDGVDDVALVSADLLRTLDTLSNSVTVEAWVRPRRVNGIRYLLSRVEGLEDRFVLGLNSGRAEFNLNRVIARGGLIRVGHWVHVAGTYDGRLVRLFLDGFPIDSAFSTKGVSLDSSALLIGNDATNTRAFDGTIDEIRIWGEARSSAQIRENMYTRLSGSEPGLVVYLPLDEGSGQVFGNAVGSGSVGTLGSSTAINSQDPKWKPSPSPDLPREIRPRIPYTGMIGGSRTKATSAGLSISDISFLHDSDDFVWFGPADQAYPVTDDLPSGIETRWATSWGLAIDDGGSTRSGTLALTFNNSIAGEGMPPGDVTNLRLLFRTSPEERFNVVFNQAGQPVQAFLSRGMISFFVDPTKLIQNTQGIHEQILGEVTVGFLARVVPAEFGSLETAIDSNRVTLSWTTTSETRNAGFYVQERTPYFKPQDDMIEEMPGSFRTIAFVDGSGTVDGQRRYSAEVARPASGMHFFRLKSVDLDGYYSLSPEIGVKVPAEGIHSLEAATPNPFSDSAQFRLVVGESQDVRITLTGESGDPISTIFEGRVGGDELWQFEIGAGSLPNGRYFYEVQGETFSDSRSITLLRWNR